jgi:ubiquinone/menaquinone biosynthesis C-methylase UbiE
LAKGLYALIGGGKDGDISSKVIAEFLERNPSLDGETRERLLHWQKDLEYWHSYAMNVSIKYRRTYRESPTYKSMVKAVNEFIAPSKGQIWLDAGCGALQMSELIYTKSKEVNKVYAMDVFLEAARGRLSQMDTYNIELVYGSLTDSLPFPDNFFDGIIGNCAFTFIVEHNGEIGAKALSCLFQEMYRVLKPGGILVWSSPRKNANNLLGAVPSIGYALNPYLWFKQKSFLPLGVAMILKHTRVLLKKGENGTYPILFRSQYDEILSSIGFIDSEWKDTFGKQGEANRVFKKKV